METPNHRRKDHTASAVGAWYLEPASTRATELLGNSTRLSTRISPSLQGLSRSSSYASSLSRCPRRSLDIAHFLGIIGWKREMTSTEMRNSGRTRSMSGDTESSSRGSARYDTGHDPQQIQNNMEGDEG